jgi:hypothetical protein
MNMTGRSRALLLALAVLTISRASFAWDGTPVGIITSITAAEGGNMPFRVSLSNQTSLCGNSWDWAYLSDADGNYKVQVATLLFAKSPNGHGAAVDNSRFKWLLPDS